MKDLGIMAGSMDRHMERKGRLKASLGFDLKASCEFHFPFQNRLLSVDYKNITCECFHRVKLKLPKERTVPFHTAGSLPRTCCRDSQTRGSDLAPPLPDTWVAPCSPAPSSVGLPEGSAPGASRRPVRTRSSWFSGPALAEPSLCPASCHTPPALYRSTSYPTGHARQPRD